MSRKLKLRRIAVSSLLALSAMSVALPAGAQGMSEADAIKQAETLRLQRRNEEAVKLLEPYTATSKNGDLFRQIGRSQRELRTPKDCEKAVEYFTKAIQINGNNVNYYADRAGAHDCLGRPNLEERLADRDMQVKLRQAAYDAAPTSTTARNDLAAALSDRGGAHSALVAPGEFMDIERAKLALADWTKALELNSSRLGTRRDRAGLLNDRFRNPGAGANDLGEALRDARALDQNVVNNARERGITARIFSAFNVEGIRSYLYTGTVSANNRVAQTYAAQLRNEGVDALSKFIEAFEQKEMADGRAAAFADTRFGAGSLDIAGAYENRAILYTARNERDKALADYIRRTELEPREPNYWWNLAQQYDRMGNSSGVKSALAKFFELVTGGHNNNVSAARGLLAKHGG